MESKEESSEKHVICGDFNLNLMINEYYADKLKSIIQFYGYKQIVNEPTRITETSSTLIDLVITNFRMKIEMLTRRKSEGSD